MSETLEERVRKHLEAGVQPTFKGRRVILKDVVLVKADGRETPVAEEARRLEPNIDLSFWSGETGRQKTESSPTIAKVASTRYRGRRANRS